MWFGYPFLNRNTDIKHDLNNHSILNRNSVIYIEYLERTQLNSGAFYCIK